MDWAQMYEDAGSDLLHQGRAHRAVSVLFPQTRGKNKGYSEFVAYCLTVNYILGVGSLGLPYAIARSGLLLGAVLMLMVSAVTLLTVNWVLEAMYRVDAMGFASPEARPFAVAGPGHERKYRIHRKVEVVQLCDTILGHKYTLAYQFCLGFLMVTGLWAYCSVFASSVLAIVPLFGCDYNTSAQVLTTECSHAYQATLFAFALIVVPLSFLELSEQIKAQVFLTVARFVTIFLIIGSAAACMWVDKADSFAADMPDVEPPYATNNLVSWSGFGVMFGTSLFSQLFQHSVPGLAHPLRRKSRLRLVFGATLATTLVLYLALGGVCASYFGDRTKPSINMNWADFTWGYENGVVPGWAKALSWLILLFPALDTVSVFPLIAITLGNSLTSSVPRFVKERVSQPTIQNWCRGLATLPPIVGALFVRDLSKILQVGGVFGLFIAFFTPALLQLLSRRITLHDQLDRPAWGDGSLSLAVTPYEWHFSKPLYAYACLAFGTVSLVMTIYSLITV